MKTRFTLILVIIVFVAALASAQSKHPRTVRDFFMAIPAKYFSLDCCDTIKDRRKAMEKYLKTYLEVEDTANGFMRGGGDGAQEGFEMALFKRPNGTYLIGFYTFGEGGIEDTPWTIFLDYNRGRWTDVSHKLVSNYSKEKFVYKLPRHGTTVEVFEKDENGEEWNRGKKLYDLVWKNGTFSVKR
jgi:hypothetical protein